MRILYILRGLPGSGKTTLANLLSDWNFEADHFHYNDEGHYDYKPENVHAAHKECQRRVASAMVAQVHPIVVSNTSTTEKELQPYLEMAEQYGYTVFSLVVENRHGNESVHDVPDETIEKMRNRFSIKL